jgi:hypothetical protein
LDRYYPDWGCSDLERYAQENGFHYDYTYDDPFEGQEEEEEETS